jgi:hypothetical protein
MKPEDIDFSPLKWVDRQIEILQNWKDRYTNRNPENPTMTSSEWIHKISKSPQIGNEDCVGILLWKDSKRDQRNIQNPALLTATDFANKEGDALRLWTSTLPANYTHHALLQYFMNDNEEEEAAVFKSPRTSSSPISCEQVILIEQEAEKPSSGCCLM